jgi:hypothetical protein
VQGVRVGLGVGVGVDGGRKCTVPHSGVQCKWASCLPPQTSARAETISMQPTRCIMHEVAPHSLQGPMVCGAAAVCDSRDVESELLSLPQQLQACSLPHKLLADKVAEGYALSSPAGAGNRVWGSEGVWVCVCGGRGVRVVVVVEE